MSKLSLDALKERAEATVSMELMETINGGTENSCHVKPVYQRKGGFELIAHYIVEGISSLFD